MSRDDLLIGETYSDDCATWSSLDVREYDVPGEWFPFFVDGVHVAEVKLSYEKGDWQTTFRPTTGHKVEVRQKGSVGQ